MQPHLELKPISATFGVTVGTTIVALPGLPAGAKKALIQFESNDARACFDATTTVTAGVGGGFYFAQTTHYVIEGYDLLNRMRMVGQGGVAKINAIYLGEEQPGDTA